MKLPQTAPGTMGAGTRALARAGAARADDDLTGVVFAGDALITAAVAGRDDVDSGFTGGVLLTAGDFLAREEDALGVEPDFMGADFTACGVAGLGMIGTLIAGAGAVFGVDVGVAAPSPTRESLSGITNMPNPSPALAKYGTPPIMPLESPTGSSRATPHHMPARKLGTFP